MTINQRQDSSPHGIVSRVLRWVSVILLSGAGSVLAVRLATSPTLDDVLATLFLFLFLPGAAILLAGLIRRPLGMVLALAIPFAWTTLSRDPSDSLALWAIPALTFPLILLAGRRYRGGGLRFAAAALSLVLAAAALYWPLPKAAEKPGPKVVLFGIDGATWNLIDPYVAKGRMPNLERLMERSHRAKLRTLNTMLSPQIWSTIATGCTPEVHGILDFAYRQDNLRVGRIWDRLRLDGRSFGLCGWYFTWPPEPGIEDVDFIVPSRFAPDDQVFPPSYSFYRQLESWVRKGERRGFRTNLRKYASAGVRAWQHGVRLSTLRMGLTEVLARRLGDRRELDDHWRARRISVALQGDLLAELTRSRSPEFIAALFTQLDHVSHRYWKYMRPEQFPNVDPEEARKYGGVIE
jgi:hypothetical protein